MRYTTRLLTLLLCGLLIASVPAVAQDDDDATDALPIATENIDITTETDAFGQVVPIITGTLVNEGEDAYANIQVTADLFDGDEQIGEGFGFVVDQCGNAILDFPLQPAQSQQVRLSVELYDADTTADDISDIDVNATGDATAPEDLDLPQPDSVTQIDTREVVNVQWIDDETLRYGVGCDESVFTTYDWYRYSLADDDTTDLDAHPAEEFITEAFITQTGINRITQSQEQNPELFDNSYLTFPEQAERIIFQNDIYTIITTQRDGSFRRVVHDTLSRYSLQGFNWSPLGNFVAYYYGAYGDPVRYFTGSAQGSRISALLPDNPISQTVPGLTNDARRVIIGNTFENDEGDPITGYWLQSALGNQRELLFEVDEDALPGNNYPAPAYLRAETNTRYIYVIRPNDDSNILQCYHREAGNLYTLTDLPLLLDTDERAWSYLSPEGDTLAIAANGNHSGLWLVDLTAFDECQ